MIFYVLILAFAGTLVYRNAFGVPFVFDDIHQILENSRIHSLQWPWLFLENNRRPVLYASLAMNFHSNGFNPYTFHAFNIRVHILAAISLFLLIRKTMLLPSINEEIRRRANILSFSSALIWLVHPIHTQAVTYVIQRAESLMGMFFILSMYCASKYLTGRKIRWLVGAAILSLLSGLTKEVALVLPLMILFYDRTFISASFREALKNNRWLYLSLSVTWVVMFYLYLTTSPENKPTAGFGMKGMSPLLYLINQPAVILYYVRLIFWPYPLVFDYDWPPQTDFLKLLPTIWVLVTWIVVLVLAYRRFRIISFLGLSFLIILLPSSSIIPVKDLIFEYRNYLSTACLSILFLLGLGYFLNTFIKEKNRSICFVIIVGLICIILSGLTFQRNKVYQSELTIWLDVIKKQPFNARAFNNIGDYLMRQGQGDKAEAYLLQSVALDQSYPDAFANLATIYGKKKDLKKALDFANAAVIIGPNFPIAHNNLGSVLTQSGRYAEAALEYEKAIELGFVREPVLINWIVALVNSQQKEKAVKVVEQALKLFPESQDLKSVREELTP